VHVLILGEGETSRQAQRNAQTLKVSSAALKALSAQMRKAHQALGVSGTHAGPFPDNRFDAVDLLDIIKVIEAVKSEVKPQVVYTHHASDLNIDHQRTHQAVLAAFRPQPGEIIERILAFEVLSSTEWSTPDPARAFVPTVFVNISATLATKLQAMRAYRSELRPWPHPRSLKAIEHQARLRGAHNGFAAAEAFMLVRERVHEHT
jgi:LmbE family N-acetylglucosaminyl deacetylase